LSRKLNPLSALISNLFLQYMDKNLLRGGTHWFAARGAPALSTGGFATAERESQRTGERMTYFKIGGKGMCVCGAGISSGRNPVWLPLRKFKRKFLITQNFLFSAHISFRALATVT
jgi:hypothetical protein